MTKATTDLADTGVADEEKLEEVVVLAGVHVEVVGRERAVSGVREGVEGEAAVEVKESRDLGRLVAVTRVFGAR